MKKFLGISLFVIIAGFSYILMSTTGLNYDGLTLALISDKLNQTNECFDRSYMQISDSLLTTWDSLFDELGISGNPFAMMLHFIEYLRAMDQEDSDECFLLRDMIANNSTNLMSSVVATCAIMQKKGWDFQVFFNENEYYLGINLTGDWQVRKGNWVEKDGKSYFLKEFDYKTPVGELKSDNPASTYQCLKSSKVDLKPVPLVNSLPVFRGSIHEKRLVWFYKNKKYHITAVIPHGQAEYTMNLPASLFGTVASGVYEFNNMGLVDDLKYFVEDFGEYDKVNFLFKLSQSESIFIYDNKESIKSITHQLIEGHNDCDGRSIFLYCLLDAVLGYDSADMVFINWPNHLAIGLKPKTRTAEDILKGQDAVYIGDKYYILDPAYVGDTYWGSKMKRLSDECEIIR